MEGTIKKIVEEKGFGFVTTAAGGKDVFFHITGCANRDDFASLKPGDRVRYDTEQAEKGLRAINLRPI